MTRRQCRPTCSYRLIRIHSRGVMFTIIINALFSSSFLAISTKDANLQYPLLDKDIPFKFVCVVLSLLCPFVGLLSDSYVGRYKILVAALYLWLLSIIFMGLDLIILSSIYTLLLSYSDIVAISDLFHIMRATIHHWPTCRCVGGTAKLYYLLDRLGLGGICECGRLPCLYLKLTVSAASNHSVFRTIVDVRIAYVMIHYCDHVLMTKPQLSSPIKLIVQVLNYARKHKFPERRSAFTYWEDECPSRIDLGKDKYGGPFTVEEVENVKTVFKLLPLIICISGSIVPQGDTGFYQVHICGTIII